MCFLVTRRPSRCRRCVQGPFEKALQQRFFLNASANSGGSRRVGASSSGTVGACRPSARGAEVGSAERSRAAAADLSSTEDAAPAPRAPRGGGARRPRAGAVALREPGSGALLGGGGGQYQRALCEPQRHCRPPAPRFPPARGRGHGSRAAKRLLLPRQGPGPAGNQHLGRPADGRQLERALPGDGRRRLRRAGLGAAARGAGGLRRLDDRHGPQGRRRQLRHAAAGRAQHPAAGRLRLPLGAHDGRRREAAHPGLVRPAACLQFLEWLLHGRAAGADDGAAVPERLQRDPGRGARDPLGQVPGATKVFLLG